MNCFVIMPYADEFEDVYTVIKQAVESAMASKAGRCFRTDDVRPAGRITDRLLSELKSATICVADLTGCRPNVMWEVGFAMALGKPIIVITQNIDDLPFDIKDMQSIRYRRTHLSSSLGAPLQRVIVDTLASLTEQYCDSSPQSDSNELVGRLLNEVGQLKEMVAEAVRASKGIDRVTTSQSDSELQGMCGHWFNIESKSHVYMKVINGELFAPYCFGGDSYLTGAYYEWRRTGEYWFARYQWKKAPISGFTFLKRESIDSLVGAWWSAESEEPNLDTPPRGAGVPASWVRKADKDTPAWAEAAFKEVEKNGLRRVFSAD